MGARMCQVAARNCGPPTTRHHDDGGEDADPLGLSSEQAFEGHIFGLRRRGGWFGARSGHDSHQSARRMRSHLGSKNWFTRLPSQDRESTSQPAPRRLRVLPQLGSCVRERLKAPSPEKPAEAWFSPRFTRVVGPEGFEPTTNGLKVHCSTAELRAQIESTVGLICRLTLHLLCLVPP